MPYFRDLITLANPPGTENQGRATRRTRGERYVPPLQILGAFLRWAWPIPRIGTWAAVTLHEDVREVLSRPDIFGVPFGEEIARLNDGQSPGTPFILGIDDPAAHRDQLARVMAAFARDDVKTLVRPIAREKAKALVHGAAGKLEAIRGLITAVPIEVCEKYYGVPVGDKQRFADAALDVSGHLFGLPPIKPGRDQEAGVLRTLVDAAIAAAKLAPANPRTIVSRLVQNGVPDNEIRAILMGMIMGFVPTNTMAGGHILEMLLKRPGFLAAARQAALDGDDVLLGRCLFEALRYMPINFGPFRICKEDYVVAAGTPREKKIPRGTKVLASTMSAMFDRGVVERPFEFVPGRPASSYMHLGFGMHWCAGAFIAQEQIVQTFKALLLKKHLRRTAGDQGELQRRSMFPDRLVVEYSV